MQNEELNTTQAISAQGIAEKLAVSSMTIKRLITTGDLRAHRVGRQWRVFERDLQDYLARQRNQRA
jgi:excisionase family DNA binding protein